MHDSGLSVAMLRALNWIICDVPCMAVNYLWCSLHGSDLFVFLAWMWFFVMFHARMWFVVCDVPCTKVNYLWWSMRDSELFLMFHAWMWVFCDVPCTKVNYLWCFMHDNNYSVMLHAWQWILCDVPCMKVKYLVAFTTMNYYLLCSFSAWQQHYNNRETKQPNSTSGWERVEYPVNKSAFIYLVDNLTHQRLGLMLGSTAPHRFLTLQFILYMGV